MNTAELLNRERYQPTILCGPQTGAEGSLLEEARNHGINVVVCPELVREVHIAKDIIVGWKLYRLLRRERYVIVHTHSSKAGIIGRLAAKLAGTPIIIHTVHGWSFHNHMHPKKQWVCVLLERICARFTDAMIVVAESDIHKGLQENIGNSDLYHVIRSAIHLEEFHPEKIEANSVRRELTIPFDAPVLGNVGRFSPQKNPLHWVKVASIVAREIPECRFLLVGDGPLRSAVESAIAEANLTKRTILTGIRRDIPQLLSAMDVFLLTSLWEGLPRVIPQAMAMRVPVVANRANGTVEAIEHSGAGYLCTPNDTAAMANRCIQLLRNKDLRENMGERGRAFAVREFDVHDMIRDIEGLYEKLVVQKIPAANLTCIRSKKAQSAEIG